MKRTRLLLGQLLDHGMAAGHDAHLAGIGKRRPRVAILGRHLRQRAGDIQLRDRGGGRADARRMLGGELAQLAERSRFSSVSIFSSASRTLLSSSFNSGVVKRSALTSVCLRS